DATSSPAIELNSFEEVVDDQKSVPVYVNKQPVILHGKDHYMFVDVFDFIDFDLSKANGRTIVTRVNGREAEYTQELFAKDQVEVFWQ
ncbi:MAG: cell division protein FtsA, partial [Lachnospiraceae bacterium]|nr:cell division protein FtsA [Lachnospiraceae bacterium]